MAPTPQPDSEVHPVVRNALRVSLSAKEYKALHDYAQRSRSLQNKLPTPARFESITRSKNKYNETAVRASLRVFLASGALMKLVDFVIGRIQKNSAQYETTLVFNVKVFKGNYRSLMCAWN